MKRLAASPLFVAYLLLLSLAFQPAAPAGLKWTPTPTVTRTATAPVSTATPLPSATSTVAAPTATVPPFPTATATVGAAVDPYPAAPLCPDSGAAHPNTVWHGLWDGLRGCHYDHEHGDNPFTAEVAAAFPGFDLLGLLGGVEIGHTNPSGAMENTHKHGGFKWNVQLAHPQGCAGFEGAANGVNGSVIEYHGFGDYGMELEAAVHSTAALLRLCNSADPANYGYLYTVQHQTYGQIVTPYQGTVLPMPYYSVSLYLDDRGGGGFGQYITVNCIDPLALQCRRSVSIAARTNVRSSSNWSSKPTGPGPRPEGSTLFMLLWRAEDAPQNFAWADQTYPYTLLWLCSSDGGLTRNAAGCWKTNTTTQVHEVAGVIPAAWDNLAGFDTQAQAGRVTATGYTSRFGTLDLTCAAPSATCFPLVLVNAPVGRYGSVLVFTDGKGVNVVPVNPSRNVYFCAGLPCAASDAGAVPSGWVGPSN